MALEDRLFAVPDPELKDRDFSGPRQSAALGKVSEMAAISKLLVMGHRVAVPVVDDDGVDFVVNYRTTVQVKSTARYTARQRAGHYGEFRWNFTRGGGARRGPNQERPCAADVAVLHARDVDRWWVVPRWALSEANSLHRVSIREHRTNRPLKTTLNQWEDAWHVFGEE